MSITKKTAIVVPNWNGREMLGDCLDSLLGQSFKDYLIIVVDNGSSDGSSEFVRQYYPKIRLIARERNYGFTGGVNSGIEMAMAEGAELIALFNNDALADRQWLECLVQAARQHPEAGIITGKLLQQANRELFDAAGDFYSVWGFPFPRGRDEVDRGQYDRAEEVFAASGGASLYRAAMLRQIGLFDQDFFAYYEDQDISFRAQLAGWRVRYEPKAVAYHQMGATSARLAAGPSMKSGDPDSSQVAGFKPNNFARYHSIKNFYFLYLKNMPGWLFWKYLPRFTVGLMLICANSLKRRQLGPLFKALLQIFAKTFGMLRKRHQIQRRRTVSLSYIDSILYKAIPPTQKTLLRLRQRLVK